MERLRVLHGFALFGNPSEIWGYRLLEGLELAGVDNQVAAFEFWDGNFPEHTWRHWNIPSLHARLGPVERLLQRRFYPGRLAKYLHSGDIDLIHAHFGHTAWRYLPLVERLKKPFVVSFYGMDYTLLPRQNANWLSRYKLLFEQADLVLSEGPSGAGKLQQLGCPADKIRISKLGIRPDLLAIQPRHKPVNSLKLLQIASFIEKKGHIHTLLAFKSALAYHPDLHLTLAGDGAVMRQQCEQFVRENGLESRVTIRDFVPYAQLHAFLQDYDVFIHPSCHADNGDCEGGAPTILLEAQAMGMPVISTRHCDIPSEVLHGQTGLLTAEKDHTALADAIQTFYQMPDEQYQKYSRSAREHVERLYDIVQNAADLAGLYRTIVR